MKMLINDYLIFSKGSPNNNLDKKCYICIDFQDK